MAIILPRERPALDVVDDSFTVAPGEWADLGESPIRERIEAAIRVTARLEAPGQPNTPFLGTAVLVLPELLATADYSVRGVWPLGVSFGRERDGSQGPTIPVVEVIPAVKGGKVALLRLEQPIHDRALPTLSPAPPEDVDGRVVVVGYPAFDQRNDPSLQDELFRSKFNIKRVLPGRASGAVQQQGVAYLRHDCSTLGGCGGAPVVDLESGEIVGINHWGRYLQENGAVPAWRVLELLDADGPPDSAGDSSRPEIDYGGGLESLGADDPDDRPDPPPGPPSTRPVISASDLAREPDWGPVLSHRSYQPSISTVLRGCGQVLGMGRAGRLSFGTGFVVGDRRVLASSHDGARLLVAGMESVAVRDELWVYVDFSAALGKPPGHAVARVKEARFVHPWYAVMLLELEGMPQGLAELPLASTQPQQLSGRPMAVVAAEDDGLTLYPGVTRQLSRHPERNTTVFVHDAVVSKAVRGSPVLDVGTGLVWGIQCATPASQPMAEPTWELARDPRVWTHELTFASNPTPEWMDHWEDTEGSPAPARRDAGPPPVGDGVDFVGERFQKLLTLCLELRLVRSEVTLIASEAQIDSTILKPPQAEAHDLWLDLLEKARGRGTLPLLLDALLKKVPNRADDFRRVAAAGP